MDVSGAAAAADTWQVGDRLAMPLPQLGETFDAGIERIVQGPGHSRSFRGFAVGTDEGRHRFVLTVGPTRVLAGRWIIDWSTDAPEDVLQVHLFEESGRDSEGNPRWHRHEAVTLWAVPQDDATGGHEFVDILTDTDGDGFGDVNERLAGSVWDEPDSTPGESVVDVLALYTAAFRDEEEGYPYTRLLHALEVSSALLEDGGTNIRLRIVGMSEVELDEGGWANSEARAELMDSHGADLSVQFGPKGPCASGGCAQVGASYKTRWSDAQSWDAGGSVWVTVHELGHAMGLAHSYRQSESYGAWRFSRGHYVSPRNEGERLRTIMAYGGRVLGGVFSDPLADCGAGPCGVDGDELEGADAVTTLNRMRFQIAAKDLSPLSGMTRMNWLNLADNLVEDIGDLAGLVNVRTLDASANRITDVSTLSAMADLRWLSLRDNAVVDIGALAGLVNLRTLNVAGNRITDLSGLSAMTQLTWLSFGDNAVEHIDALAGPVELRTLEAGGNRIKDISALSDMTAMRWLSLRANAIADIAQRIIVMNLLESTTGHLTNLSSAPSTGPRSAR